MYDLLTKAIKLANSSSLLIKKCPDLRYNLLIQSVVALADDLKEDYENSMKEYEARLIEQYSQQNKDAA